MRYLILSGVKLLACLTNGLGTTAGLFQVISSYIYLMSGNGSVQLGKFSGVDKEYSTDPSKLLQGTVWRGIQMSKKKFHFYTKNSFHLDCITYH